MLATVVPGKGYHNCTPPTGTAWMPFTGDHKINAHFDFRETERLQVVSTGKKSQAAMRVDRMQRLQYRWRIFSRDPHDDYDVPWQRPQRITHQGDPYMRLLGFRGSDTNMLPDETLPKHAGYKAPPAGLQEPPAPHPSFKRLRPSAVPPSSASSGNQLIDIIDLTGGVPKLGLPGPPPTSRQSWLPTVPEDASVTWIDVDLHAGMETRSKSHPPRPGQLPPMPSRMPPLRQDNPEERDADAKRHKRSST